MKGYIRRCNNEITQVDSYDDGITLFVIIERLRIGKLWWSFLRKPLTFYFVMLARAKKYANAEERFQNRN